MKKIVVPFVAVVVCMLVPFVGVRYAGLDYLFGVVVPYAAAALFVSGSLFRVFDWLRRPVPYTITTTCGQQEALDWIAPRKIESPPNLFYAAIRVLSEVLLFRSLFRNTRAELRPGADLVYGSSKWLWLAGLVFHWSLFVIVLRHARFFFVMVPGFVTVLDRTDSFFDITLPAIYLSGALALLAVTVLVLRRVTDAKLRILSLPTDYFPLFLLGGIVSVGILMRHVARIDVMAVKEQMLRLVHFSFDPPGAIGTLFYVHLFLVCVLLVYFPFSKLVHMGAIVLSPTRSMANNSRAKMHVNPWRQPMKIRTYAEYEDDYREKMKKAKLPLEKE